MLALLFPGVLMGGGEQVVGGARRLARSRRSKGWVTMVEIVARLV